MYIPLNFCKENAFIDVAIPSNKSFFSRLGEVVPSKGLYSPDDVVRINQDKIQQIEDYQKFVESEIAKDNSNSE